MWAALTLSLYSSLLRELGYQVPVIQAEKLGFRETLGLAKARKQVTGPGLKSLSVCNCIVCSSPYTVTLRTAAEIITILLIEVLFHQAGQSAFQVLNINILEVDIFCSHYKDGKIEAYKRQVSCPRSQSKEVKPKPI